MLCTFESISATRNLYYLQIRNWSLAKLLMYTVSDQLLFLFYKLLIRLITVTISCWYIWFRLCSKLNCITIFVEYFQSRHLYTPSLVIQYLVSWLLHRRACAARITVLGLCVCLHLFLPYRDQAGSSAIPTALAQQGLEKLWGDFA